MGVIQRPFGFSGGQIWADDDKPFRIYGAVGEGVRFWGLRPGLPCDDTTLVPTELISTVTGTSPLTAGVAAGYPLLLTTGATEYNGANVQLRGAVVSLAASKEVIVRAKIKMSEANTSDFLFGLAELKTDLLATGTGHAVTASAVEGVFFHKPAGASSAAISVKSYKNGTLATSIAAGTMTTADIEYALYWDGLKIHALINNVEVASFAGTLPDGVLTLSLNIRAGAAAAITASIAELAMAYAE